MEEPRWTLDELAEQVETALAVDYHGQASGRVRAVPDRRAIRWYTTIGLIDRPVAHRGRTTLYGPRHLLQLVAVKRLQARGLPLVSIQQELAVATARQAPVAPRPARAKATRARFWREQPAAFTAAADADANTAADRTADPTDPADPGRDQAGTERAATLRGVRLGDGATLLLEPGRELGSEDVQAILDAARPLLATLRDRGLGAGARSPRQGPEARPAGGTEPRREHP